MKTSGSGKKRLISIIKPAVNEIQAKATTGAVDKYVVKSFIKLSRKNSGFKCLEKTQ